MVTEALRNRLLHRFAAIIIAAGLGAPLLSGPPLLAEDAAAESRQDRDLATARLDAMRDRVLAATVQSREASFPVKFSEKPLFRYSDPDRGYLAAAVWKLGETGRPKAFIVSELIPKPQDRVFLSCELISMTDTPFQVHSDDLDWSPSSTLVEFKPIPDGPAPLDTPALRLRQLRELARRFTGSEIDKNEKCELRLLPQPIGRYQPGSDANSDAAIFILAYGTNPELMLLIETQGKGWVYGVSRMSGAEEITLKFDDQQVWQGPAVEPGPTSPYTGTWTAINAPDLVDNAAN